MAKARKDPARFPSRDEIRAFIRETPGRVGKREIARAFGIKGEQRTALNEVLRELKAEGAIGGARAPRASAFALPKVAVIEVTGTDTDGEVLARPVEWREERPPPIIYLAPEKRGRGALGPGERVLARLARARDGSYEARPIKRLPGAPKRLLGVYRRVDGQGRLKSISRRDRGEYVVGRGDAKGAEPGELVEAEVLAGRRLGLREARVVERLGVERGSRSISIITLHDHAIPHDFPAAAIEAAEAAAAAPLAGREDLRDVPLVTIDGEDARDFDDAVWAEADSDAGNAGGWNLIVAIADVAWYVRSGSALDAEARRRGNSVYFPDRVVPMLPAPLSEGWCSLRPAEDRSCLFVRMRIDAQGRLLGHRFGRGMMRSAQRLTYSQVQAAADGGTGAIDADVAARVIAPLYGAYRALDEARRARGVLELDLPERRVRLNAEGEVEAIEIQPRYDSHRLIEEFMITANVAAAEALEKVKQPCMYRIHDTPTDAKLEALRTFLDSLGIKLPKAEAVRPSHFNRILAEAADTPQAKLVNEMVLRSQAQAAYAPANIGHFGLALRRYAHFTSPIRRYADLLVHRALIAGLGLGGGALGAERDTFAEIGEQISFTERRAQAAERDAVDRFTAAHLAERVGATFRGRITGVTRFGLFVTLDESGADGLVPAGTLPADTYVHDEAHHVLKGLRSGRRFELGANVEARLVEAEPLTGGIILHLMGEGDGKARASRSRRRH